MYDRDVIIPLFDSAPDSDLQPFLSNFCMCVYPNLILPTRDGCPRKLLLSKATRAVAPFFADSILALPRAGNVVSRGWKLESNK